MLKHFSNIVSKYCLACCCFQILFCVTVCSWCFLDVANDCLNDDKWEFAKVSGSRGKNRRSNKKRKFLIEENRIAEIKPAAFFLQQQIQFVWLRPRCAHHFIHVKEIVLLADSNCITWAPSFPCCLLSRPPVSRLGTVHTLPSETKELHNFSSRGSCALTWVIATSHKALFHLKPRASPTAAELTVSKTPPEGSADLGFPHQANRGGILPSGHDLKRVPREFPLIWACSLSTKS